MAEEVIMYNEAVSYRYIFWNQEEYFVKDSSYKPNKPINGDGGFMDDDKLVGIFVREDDLIFLWDNKEYIVLPEELVCTNNYITKETRCFEVVHGGDTICKCEYIPYTSPTFPIQGGDADEFDYLLYLSRNIMKNKESLIDYKKNMKRFTLENIII